MNIIKYPTAMKCWLFALTKGRDVLNCTLVQYKNNCIFFCLYIQPNIKIKLHTPLYSEGIVNSSL